jgi:H+/Cl- antiporter ClcA
VHVLVGVVAMLGAGMRVPLTALVMVIELTGSGLGRRCRSPSLKVRCAA